MYPDLLAQRDLVYGLAESRIELMTSMGLPSDIQSFYIDQYNTPTRTLLGMGSNKTTHYEKPDTSNLHRYIAKLQSDPDKKPFGDALLGFCQFSEKCESTIGKIGHLNYYELHGSFGESCGDLNSFITRRCKFGIAWAISAEKPLHFLLKGIDLKKCFSKTY